MLDKRKLEEAINLTYPGLTMLYRDAILSNHYLDAFEFEHGTNWGLCIMQKDSFFKVLDIYKKQNKTQITLLHLPDQYWKLFRNVVMDLDTELIAYVRKSFDKHITGTPVPELAKKDWMDDKGNLFHLPTL